jgi:hypothetical protein
MQPRLITIVSLVALLIGLGATSFAQGSRTAPREQTTGEVPYVSGGLGQEEREQLRQMAAQYNLRLTFSIPQGNYLSTVGVTIRDMRGTPVLETVAQGPLLYAKLPPGEYTVSARAYNQHKQQTVRIKEAGPSELQVVWQAPTTAEGRQ